MRLYKAQRYLEPDFKVSCQLVTSEVKSSVPVKGFVFWRTTSLIMIAQ